MRTLTVSLLLCAALLSACSHSDGSDEFSGTYAATVDHDVRPLIRIFRSDGRYMLARTEHGLWINNGVPMEPVSRGTFEQYLGHPVKGDIKGLTYASATLMRLPVGFAEGKFVSHTGYLLITAAGPIEVKKQ